MKQRILNLLIALDQLAWVIVTLGKGKPDETISAAAWRMEQEGKLEKDHCYLSWLSEVRGKQLHPSYRAHL